MPLPWITQDRSTSGGAGERNLPRITVVEGAAFLISGPDGVEVGEAQETLYVLDVHEGEPLDNGADFG